MNLSKHNSDGSSNVKPIMIEQIKQARKAKRFVQARMILAHLKLIKELEKQCALVAKGLPYK